MARVVVLDAGPLGLASRARGLPQADAARDWIQDLAVRGVRVVVPEIADYEVRRELTRARATGGLRRLDQLEAILVYDPLTTAVMRRAAELWALARQAGLPTAHPQALDGDCILAAQADRLGRSGDAVTVATDNVGHLARFPGIDARP